MCFGSGLSDSYGGELLRWTAHRPDHGRPWHPGAEEDWIRYIWCGPNDGGIKRGDRADTGDEEANPTEGVDEGGSGSWGGNSGQPTGDSSSLGGGTSPDDEGEGQRP